MKIMMIHFLNNICGSIGISWRMNLDLGIGGGILNKNNAKKININFLIGFAHRLGSPAEKIWISR